MSFPVVNGMRAIEFGTKGAVREELNALVLMGKKRATAGILEWDYQTENEPIETVGEYLAVLDSNGRHIATIQTLRVDVVKFSQVPDEFALAEGEGDLSGDDFRASHMRYWSSHDLMINDDTLIVLQYFELVEDLSRTVSALSDGGFWYSNPRARDWQCPEPSKDVAIFHQNFPGYEYTPLIELPSLANELGVGRLFIKDESTRLNLSAFKILGASWAVAQTLTGGESPKTIDEVLATLDSENLPILIAATDGNHGRAVAHMARRLGLGCQIIVPKGVSQKAIDNIADEGAQVIVIDGNYDQAIDLAKINSLQSTNAVHVQDISWPGYDVIPQWIIEGYTTLCVETDAQLESLGAPPADLVAVPVGVGSLLHSVLAHYRSKPHHPVVLSVEPIGAACVLKSLQAGEMVSVETVPTIMAGMNCGTPSSDSWPHHHAGVDAAVALSDDQTRLELEKLKALGVDAGPCGAATLAGVREALRTRIRREELAITEESIIVLFSTEGSAANPFN